MATYTKTVLKIVDSNEITDKVLDALGNPDLSITATWRALQEIGLSERTCDLIITAFAAGRDFEDAYQALG